MVRIELQRAVRLILLANVATLAIGVAMPSTASAWLAAGRHTQYPFGGGVWEYGFWDAKVRSYYRVGRCHGSTARYNGNDSRSVDTSPNQTSIAEKWAYNSPWNDDAYFYRFC